MESAMRILSLPAHNLSEAWVACIDKARMARDVVEEELDNRRQAQASSLPAPPVFLWIACLRPCSQQVEHIKRTHDYEPFIQQFVTCLHNEGLLYALLPATGKSGSKPKRARAGAKS
jgi:ubiquitin carboxyl-terminal hydrolase L5